MKRVKFFAFLLPFLLGMQGLAIAASDAHGGHGEEKAGDIIMHHILDTRVMDFEPFGSFELPSIVIGGFDLSITKHVVIMWLASAILLLIFVTVGNRYKAMTARQAPSGMANTMEALVEFIRLDVAKSNIGAGYEKHLPYLLTVFVFILMRTYWASYLTERQRQAISTLRSHLRSSRFSLPRSRLSKPMASRVTWLT